MTLVAAPPAQAAPIASAASPATSIPIDVVFASESGTTNALTQADYDATMTTATQWWTTQARGLIAPGAFTWTSYAQVPMIQTPLCSDSSDILAASEQATGYGHGAYYGTTGARQLLVFAAPTATGATWCGNPTTFGHIANKVGFPGYGEILIPTGSGPQTETLEHEMGHAFGLMHAAGVFTCASATTSDDGYTFGLAGGTAADCLRARPSGTGQAPQYGDHTNIMSNLSDPSTTSLSGSQKRALGIIDDGSGQATVAAGTSPSYTLARSDTASRTDLQAIHVVDPSWPAAQYTIDFPDASRYRVDDSTPAVYGSCTVRVVRDIALSTNPDMNALAAMFTSDLADTGLYFPKDSNGKVSTSMVDTLRVDIPHAGSMERCLSQGDTFVSATGDVRVSVTGVGTTSATVRVTNQPSTSLATVTFNANGGSGNVPAPISAQVGQSMTMPDQGGLTRTGYFFAGWNTAAAGTGTTFAPGSSAAFPSSRTMYAMWTTQPTLTLSSSQWGNIPAEGGSTTVSVVSNTSWSVTVPSWVSASPSSGTGNATVRLTATVLPDSNARNGSALFSTTNGSPAVSASVSLSQSGPWAEAWATSSTDIAAGGGSVTVTVESNTSWSVTTPSWISASPSSGTGNATVTLTVAPNTSASARTDWADVTVPPSSYVSYWVSWGVSVTQAGAAPTCPSSAAVSVSGSAAVDSMLTATPSASGSVGSWSYQWLRGGVPIAGAIASIHTLTAVDVGLPVSVQVSAATDGCATLTATSSATTVPSTLSVSPASWSAILAGGGSVTVTVTSNTSWSLSTPTWVSASLWACTGNATVTLTAAANSGGSTRSGTALFRLANGSSTASVALSQAGAPTLSMSPGSWVNIPTSGGSTTMTVTSNTSWAALAPSWVSVSPSSGVGNTTVTLTVAANTTASTRTNNVTFKTTSDSPGPAWSVFLSQAGMPPTLMVSPGIWTNIPLDGASTTMSVSSNTSWTATAPDWASVSPSSGTGNATVTIRTVANAGTTRSGNISFTTTAGSPALAISVPLSQAGTPGAFDDCGSSLSAYCTWVSLGTPVGGAIEASGDKDWFRIVPLVSGTWTFTASRPGLNPLADSYGTLYASNGTTVLAADDDSGGNLQFKVTADLVAGQAYFLEVRAYSTGTGTYTVTAISPPEIGATSISVAPLVGTPAVQAGSGMTVLATATPSTVSIPQMGLTWVSSNPAVARLSSASTSILPAMVTVFGVSPGTAVITATSVNGTVGSLVVTVVTDDCGGTMATGCEWTLSSSGASSITKRLEIPMDADLITFTAPSSGTWTFTSSGLPAGAALNGGVFDLNNTALVTDVDGGSLSLSASLVLGQTYYLYIVNADYSTAVTANPYTITATPPR